MSDPAKITIPIPQRLRVRFASEIDTDLVKMTGAIGLYNESALTIDEAVVFGGFRNREMMFVFWVSMLENFSHKAYEMMSRQRAEKSAMPAKRPD